MKNIFKIIIANNATFTIFMVISLLANAFFAYFPTNINTHFLQKEKEAFQLRSHLYRIYSAINIPIELANKILRCDTNIESKSKTLVYNTDYYAHCIIKKGKTNNTSQKKMTLNVFF